MEELKDLIILDEEAKFETANYLDNEINELQKQVKDLEDKILLKKSNYINFCLRNGIVRGDSITAEMIINTACRATKLSLSDIKQRTRVIKIVHPRQATIYFLYIFFNVDRNDVKNRKYLPGFLTEEKIGELFKMAHSGVIHSVKAIRNCKSNELTNVPLLNCYKVIKEAIFKEFNVLIE